MVVVVDRDAKRPRALPIAFAVFAKISDVFFLAGSANLHLVNVHPEIVLVTSIGRVDDPALTKAHRLHVIKPRTAGGVAADRMAPIKHPSFGDRCERHSAPPL
jgi:hypothetical protein